MTFVVTVSTVTDRFFMFTFIMAPIIGLIGGLILTFVTLVDHFVRVVVKKSR